MLTKTYGMSLFTSVGVIVAVMAATAQAQFPWDQRCTAEPSTTEQLRKSLSPYMNAIPPSTDYLCVGNGPSNQALHPDRAPYTKLAEQDGVILFSGAAPQQGLNFALSAGALVYRNQMSTLGGPEPPPRIGTAGTLLQGGKWCLLPWTEARWHQGEQITWEGYRYSQRWLEGLPYWDWEQGTDNHDAITDYLDEEPYSPIYTSIGELVIGEQPTGPNVDSAFNLQLGHGIYQLSKIRADFNDRLIVTEKANRLHEPWFQGKGVSPVFNLRLDTNFDGQSDLADFRMAQKYFPNFHSIYTFEQLEIDGGRLTINFEPSATWPRNATEESSGTVMAERIEDEYGNVVEFDRVPKYGWETDYKVPPGIDRVSSDPNFSALPTNYRPPTNAWRLPHKRLRTVKLFSAEGRKEQNPEPEWTIVFVYEHPESDRITWDDDGSTKGRSLYSYSPQADWKFGRFPILHDRTTLLTVQAYKRDVVDNGLEINGAEFDDDWSVWESGIDSAYHHSPKRVNTGRINQEGQRESHGAGEDPRHERLDSTDDAPGSINADDDQDGLIDEDTSGFQAFLDVPDGTTCSGCQEALRTGTGCTDSSGRPLQTYLNTWCKNPLYWDPASSDSRPMDPFARWDDDEDGLIDEDGDDDPLLVNLRALTGSDECASGKHPFVPASVSDANSATVGAQRPFAVLPGGEWRDKQCRPVLEATAANGEIPADPWTYQVQYVYARSNPYWLLTTSDSEGNQSARDPFEPVYYYRPSFGEPCKQWSPENPEECEVWDDLNEDLSYNTFSGNIHDDCVPDPDFRGLRGFTGAGGTTQIPDSVAPSDIQLIKRIVRVRPDVENEPTNYDEKVWLYRYNDMGFLKAVFDPASVQAVIDADTTVKEPDDILTLADTADVGGEPLIFYASQWYTYYNPYVRSLDDISTLATFDGIPPCYEEEPYTGFCLYEEGDELAELNPFGYMPTNGCDGRALWKNEYSKEMHIDPDCSPLANSGCGTCFARWGCSDSTACQETRMCACDPERYSRNNDQLLQMGISGALPRFRRYMVKTARVRGDDGEMHLYRFDYLGAANSVYDANTSAAGGRITSYADPHNITIVDELVEQTNREYTWREENDFYIYEDDFKLALDAAETRPDGYDGASIYKVDTHYLRVPVKVKTRRVVVMNYYGIALSDRLILTPGFDGEQTSLVDQRYELINKRGQTKHVYDESWVAVWKKALEGDEAMEGSVTAALNAVADKGRVLVELFGGHEGWYSVLSGIAWGSGGRNLYDQQCKTPNVVADVPVQRVKPDQLTVTHATQHFTRCPDGDTVFCDAPDPNDNCCVRDMPELEVAFYQAPKDDLAFSDTCTTGNCVDDPAGTIGYDECSENDTLATIDLTNQDPVDVELSYSDEEGDGKSLVHYAYAFHGGNDKQDAVKWKWRWEEPVSRAKGGTGNVALQIWYYDENGRVRLHGRGAGTPGTSRPVTALNGPFYITYFGYDDLGRLALHVEDFDLELLDHTEANLYQDGLTTGDVNGKLERIDPNGYLAANRVTRGKFNDAGLLYSRCAGFASNSDFTPTPGRDGDDAIRSDFRLLAEHKIAYRDPDNQDKWDIAWKDPYTYRFEYKHVGSGGQVFGTTSVDIFDEGGKFIERRLLGWDSSRRGQTGKSLTDKITEDVLWGISLAEDYTHDGAIGDWTPPGDDHFPPNLWACESPPCYDEDNHRDLMDNIQPEYPGATSSNTDGKWPPPQEDQIVTLARSFSLYRQYSSLKPTHEVVYRSFEEPETPNVDPINDPRAVVTRLNYDLEDRIARRQESDGNITRFLFDPRRRLTKTFRGSADDCSDWFPRPPADAEISAGDDDMLLVEHRLYNDGTEDCEHSDIPGFEDTCTTGQNENFPNNAGKLVRVRRFSGNAEDCDSKYQETTASRDRQFIYDWRGRPVIVKEVGVGHGGGTPADPAFISGTTTVYDNLDRPLFVATWSETKIGEVSLTDIDGWSTGSLADARTGILAKQPLSLSETLYDERGRPYEHRNYDVSDANGNTYTFTRTYRDDLNRVTAELSSDGLIVNKYDSLGRVKSTWHWSKEDPNSPGEPDEVNGVQLTGTWMNYDAFGNIEKQYHFDRKDTVSSESSEETLEFGEDGSVATASSSESSTSVVTATYNWYDKAKRLVATANLGTGASTGSLTAESHLTIGRSRRSGRWTPAMRTGSTSSGSRVSFMELPMHSLPATGTTWPGGGYGCRTARVTSRARGTTCSVGRFWWPRIGRTSRISLRSRIRLPP